MKTKKTSRTNKAILLRKKKKKTKQTKTPTFKSANITTTKDLNIYEDPELVEKVTKPSPKKPKERIPFQPIGNMPPIYYSYDLCEGIPIVDDSEVKGAVYLGNMDVAQNLDWLKDSNVTAIVNATSELKNFYPAEFQYMKLPIIDSSDCKISKYFDEVAEFIDEHRTKGSVLVHCQKGQSRSVTIIFSYLIKSEGKNLAEICQYFESHRIKTTMNIGFQQQIMLYEKK